MKCMKALKSQGSSIETLALIREFRSPFLGQDKLIKLIKHFRVDINFQTMWGKTALMMAVESENKDIVRAVLKHPEVDVNAKNVNGDTALILAIRGGSRDIAEMILEHPKIILNLKTGYYDNTALHEAIRINDVGMVELILSFTNMDNLNISNSYVYKPLSYAKALGNEEIVKLLIDFKNQNKNSIWKKIFRR